MEWRSRLEEFGAMASQFQLSFPRRKRSASALDVYLVLVALAGLLVCGWLLRDASTSLGNADLTFWVLAACVLPAELMRVTTWNRGSVNTLTMSRPFALALLTGWGAPLTVVVFVIASVVYTALGGQPSLRLEQVPAFIAATVVLILVNRLLVRAAVALYEQHPITIGYLLTEAQVELVEGAVQFSMVLVALLVAEHRLVLPLVLALPAPGRRRRGRQQHAAVRGRARPAGVHLDVAGPAQKHHERGGAAGPRLAPGPCRQWRRAHRSALRKARTAPADRRAAARSLGSRAHRRGRAGARRRATRQDHLPGSPGDHRGPLRAPAGLRQPGRDPGRPRQPGAQRAPLRAADDADPPGGQLRGRRGAAGRGGRRRGLHAGAARAHLRRGAAARRRPRRWKPRPRCGHGPTARPRQRGRAARGGPRSGRRPLPVRAVAGAGAGGASPRGPGRPPCRGARPRCVRAPSPRWGGPRCRGPRAPGFRRSRPPSPCRVGDHLGAIRHDLVPPGP